MILRRLNTPSLLVLVSTLLWGAIELLALFRSRRNDPGQPRGG
jgi:hypothetical protein